MKYNHLLHCEHCCNGRRQPPFKYTMRCRIIKFMPDSHRVKIAVIGDRYWKDRDGKERIRYVDSGRVTIDNQ